MEVFFCSFVELKKSENLIISMSDRILNLACMAITDNIKTSQNLTFGISYLFSFGKATVKHKEKL